MLPLLDLLHCITCDLFLMIYDITMYIIDGILAIFEWLLLALLGIIVVPAMWVMAYLYPTWEKWIKESDDFVKKWERVILIIPLTLIVLISLIIYRTLHKSFESKIKDKWGLKLF